MAYENYQRCRFWPDCMIHAGDPRPNELSPENVREVRDRVAAGESRKSVSRSMMIAEGTVNRIIRGISYKNIS